MLVRVRQPMAVGPTNSFGELPVVADGGLLGFPRTARGGVLIRPSDFNPERIILDGGRGLRHADGGRARSPEQRHRGRRLLVRQLQVPRDLDAGADQGRPQARDDAVSGRQRARDRLDERREPGRRRRAGEVRPPGAHRRRQPQGARHRRRRGDPGRRRRAGRGRLRRDGHVDALHRGDPGGRRADLPVPRDRPGARPGRRRAGRQHPRGLPVPRRPGRLVRRPAGRRRGHPERRRPDARRPAAQVQPWPHRPDQPGVRQQPQAAGGRVPLAREDVLRHRQPLQLQGRRRPAVRPHPAAGEQLGGAAPPAGRDRRRLRRQAARGRPQRERRRARGPQRLRLLRDARHPRGARAADAT